VKIRMDDSEKLNLEAIGRFVEASEGLRFEAEDRRQLYGWVERVLVGRQYALLSKAARGLLRRYMAKMTGLSRAQLTRLIAAYTASGRVEATVYRRCRFPQRYTRAEIELLASVDEAHETLSGPATRRILERAHLLYKRPEYACLKAHPVHGFDPRACRIGALPIRARGGWALSIGNPSGTRANITERSKKRRFPLR
jgi:hypothetical protein